MLYLPIDGKMFRRPHFRDMLIFPFIYVSNEESVKHDVKRKSSLDNEEYAKHSSQRVLSRIERKVL